MRSRNISGAILKRLLEPKSRSLNVDAAKDLIKLKRTPRQSLASISIELVFVCHFIGDSRWFKLLSYRKNRGVVAAFIPKMSLLMRRIGGFEPGTAYGTYLKPKSLY